MSNPVTAIGRLIRARRLELRIPQRELSELSGVARAHISYLEAGFCPQPEAETLFKLSKALKLSLEDLWAAVPRGPQNALAKFIATRRLELGLSNCEFAAKTGLTTPAVCAVQKNPRYIKRDTLLRISFALGCELDDLPALPSLSRKNARVTGIQSATPFWQFVRQRRHELRMSCLEIAHVLNANPRTVSNCEHGKSFLSERVRANATALAELLQVTSEELLAQPNVTGRRRGRPRKDSL